MDPTWVMAGAVVLGQVATSAWVVRGVKGRVDLVEQTARAAKKRAETAHDRIDRSLMGRDHHGEATTHAAAK